MFDPHQQPLPSGSPAPQPPMPVPGYIEGEVHLLDRLMMVYKRRMAAITVFTLVFLGTMVQTYTIVPMYQAQARLLIEDERSATVPGFNVQPEFFQDPEPYYNTQYRIIRGRDLARRAIRLLHLENVPEFNGQGPPPTRLSRALSSVRTQLRALRPGAAPSAPTMIRQMPDESSLIDGFLGRIEVEPVRNSRLVDVSFTSADPAFAARAVNTLAAEYVAQNLEFKVQTTEQTLNWLSDEIAKAKQKVEDTEAALANYRESQNAFSLENNQNIVTARLSQVNDALGRVRLALVQREAAYQQLQQAQVSGGVGIDTIAAVAQNPTIQSLKAQLSDLQRQKAQLSERYGDRHPEIVKANTSLEKVSAQLSAELAKVAQSVKNEYETAVAEERRLTVELEKEKNAAADLSRKGISYSMLQRDAQTNRTVYESLLQREKELRVVRNSRANNIRLIDRAEIPDAPFLPNTQRSLYIAIALGLLLGVAAAFALEYLDDTIKTPEDITRRLHIASLGLVPSVRGERHPLLTGLVPHDFREAFNSLRTSLVFTQGQDSNHIITVTSAQPLEGKTTTACNLAIALACGGSRVLLIDADMRRPSLHGALELNNEPGLSHLLVGQARARDAIQRTADPNLFVLTAGRVPPNPSELLASERMKRLLGNLAKGPFDWVIIDTPPVLAVTDAVILSPLVSGVVFVIGAEMTRRRLAERAIETLLASRPAMVAAVLNRVDLRRNKYYYSRYYGYHHKSYYSESPAANS